jgi:HSP20 family protein
MASRWQPLLAGEINRWQNEMNRLFNHLGVHAPWPGLSFSYPAVNIWESDNAVFAEAELPGLSQDQIEVYVTEGNQLTIQGERKEVERPSDTWHRRERGFGKFNRTLTLPAEVDADKVEARLEHGILYITLPKNETARPRKVAVKGGDGATSAAPV